MLRENGDLVVLGREDFCAFRFISNILDLEKLNGNKVWRFRRLKSFQKRIFKLSFRQMKAICIKEGGKIEIRPTTTTTATTATTTTTTDTAPRAATYYN